MSNVYVEALVILVLVWILGDVVYQAWCGVKQRRVLRPRSKPRPEPRATQGKARAEEREWRDKL
jgi:hypothetical protein